MKKKRINLILSFFANLMPNNFLKRRNTVIIGLFCFSPIFAFSTFAQELSGKVTDTSGFGVPGVNILIKGTNKATISDLNGNYKLSGVKKGETITFSFIGMKTNEVVNPGNAVLNVTLVDENIKIDEVVVVGYGAQKKMSVTGAISSISSKDILKSPTASVGNALSGKITGITTVQSSGAPGYDNPNIYIRGTGSPLILVDGVERDFTQIDPNEIENVSILKDASATAVYGIRGANGVIIVTTKRGQIGKPLIEVTTSTGIQNPTRLMDVADSYTWAKAYNGAQLSDAPGTNPSLMFSDNVLEKFRTNSDPLIYPNTNFPDLLMKKTAMQSQHNINMSGGNEIMKYFFSLGYLNQDGFPKNFKGENNYGYKRYNYRANIDLDLTKTTKFSVSMGGRTEIRGKEAGQVFRWTYAGSAPWAGAWVDNKHIITSKKYISISPEYDAISALGYDYADVYNRNTSNVINLDFQLKQDLSFITKGLSWRAKYSNNYTGRIGKELTQTAPYYNAVYKKDVDPVAYAGDTTVVLRMNSKLGQIAYSDSKSVDRNWYAETALNYDRTFGKHAVQGLLLYNESKRYYPSLYKDIAIGYVGLAARATYNYDNKYLAEFNAGYNGSENFREEIRFGFLPSFSAGWIVSEEDFMKDNVISFLKLRTSYGVVGNDRQDGFRFLYLPTAYNPNSGSISFGINNSTNQLIASEGKLGNPNVTWETVTKQNYGVDISFFNNKLTLNLDYFYEYAKDKLGTRNTFPSLPYIQLPAVNLGITENRGFEIEGSWKDKIGKVNYTVGGNMSFARNKVIYMDEIPQTHEYLVQTGKSSNLARGYVFEGFWSVEDAANYKNFPDAGGIPQPGDARYKDLNDDKLINSLDQQVINYGSKPEIIYSFNSSLRYKGFDFYMMWQGAENVTKDLTGGWLAIPFSDSGARGLLQYTVDNSWTPETASTATLPRITLANKNNNYSRPSSLWIKDASYLRLKNVQIGYNINSKALKSLGCSNLRLYVQAYDLLTFDNLKFMDPEGSGNIDYPLIQITTFGLTATF